MRIQTPRTLSFLLSFLLLLGLFPLALAGESASITTGLLTEAFHPQDRHRLVSAAKETLSILGGNSERSTIYGGTSVTLHVSASGTGLSYRWYEIKNDERVVLAGNERSLTVTLRTEGSHSFVCVVSDQNGNSVEKRFTIEKNDSVVNPVPMKLTADLTVVNSDDEPFPKAGNPTEGDRVFVSSRDRVGIQPWTTPDWGRDYGENTPVRGRTSYDLEYKYDPSGPPPLNAETHSIYRSNETADYHSFDFPQGPGYYHFSFWARNEISYGDKLAKQETSFSYLMIIASDLTGAHKHEYSLVAQLEENEEYHAIHCLCGKSIEYEHDWGEEIRVEATASHEGYIVKTCQSCSYAHRTPLIFCSTHRPGNWTPLDDRQHTWLCLDCGHTETEDHVWKEEVAAETETSITIALTCTLCGFSRSDTLAKAVGYRAEIGFGSGSGYYDAGDMVHITADERAGYTFTKWAVQAGKIILADAQAASTSFTMPAGDVSVEAVYERNEDSAAKSCTLSFATNGGTEIKAYTGKSGEAIDLFIYRTNRSGYRFDGWFNDAGLSKSVDTVTLDSDTTVYAKWTYMPSFSDVREGDWFYGSVLYVAGRGMMNGTGANEFSPQMNTSRGMIVTILHRLEGSPARHDTPFSDVQTGAYYAQAVAWAAANNIVGGYGGGLFGPNDPITREQMASILYRYSSFKGLDTTTRADLSAFLDASAISDYARETMAWANAHRLINGKGGGLLDPGGKATRAEVAAILSRYCESMMP